MQDNIAERVKKVIADQFVIDHTKIVDGAKLVDDLGADSLDTIELSIGVEEEFGIDLLTNDCEIPVDTVTVGAIIEHVRGQIGAGQ